LAGNLTFDGGQNFQYDATGQQTKAYYSGYTLDQGYDGNGLRVSKSENNAAPTYYLRSSALGGQVVAEIDWFSVAWGWSRGWVYSGSGLLAVQYNNAASWVHEDPITKNKRITNSSGVVSSSIELDPWGGDAGSAWSSNAAFQPRKFTTYDRDGNNSDEAMFRRYNRWHSRFDQTDPSDDSYNLLDPQSLNRYAYVRNDPVNLIDPTGLFTCGNGDLPGCQPPRDHRDDLPNRPDDTPIILPVLPLPFRPGIGPLLPVDPTQTPQKPCSEQDFSFSDGSGNYTARDLSAMVQIALGETSTRFTATEAEAVIATIVNRQNLNIAAYPQRGPFSRGQTQITTDPGVGGGILSEYDATRTQSGTAKLNEAKVNGVLPASSYVCDQLKEARTFAVAAGNMKPGEMKALYPFTSNMGIGPSLPAGATGVTSIGDTRFYVNRGIKWPTGEGW